MLYLLCLAVVSSTPAPTLEQTLVLGRERDAPWKEFTRRGGELRGVGLTSGLRGSRDIVLSDDEHAPGSGTDLLIHFNDSPFRDQSGLYRVEQGDVLLSNREAVMGRGAAAFTPQTGPITVHPRAGSLFSAGWRDFTLEFWLYPVNLIDGEEILAWSSSVTRGDAVVPQHIRCRIEDRRLEWDFVGFFGPGGTPAAGGADRTATRFILSGLTRLLPRRWHHHLVRFDSSTGRLEYLLDGSPEAILHATESEEEGATVLLPFTTGQGRLLIGPRYSGLMDELRLSSMWVAEPSLKRFELEAGTATSGIIDLELSGSRLVRIDSEFSTPAGTEVYFYYSIDEELARYSTVGPPEWVRFRPNRPLPEPARGRYLRLRIELLPDGTGMHTPTVSDLVVRYEPDLPPMPPQDLEAFPGDRSVTLRWRRVTSRDVSGYRIYYGPEPGVYRGDDAAEGPSPVTVPGEGANEATLTGLENGRLYYFAVVTYDGSDPSHESVFSREVFARPSTMLP